MPLDALALALGAAGLHALWNLLLAREVDTEAATAVALLALVVVLALPAALTWRVEAPRFRTLSARRRSSWCTSPCSRRPTGATS